MFVPSLLCDFVDAQSQSKLFQTPIEVRHAIYAHVLDAKIHIFLHNNHLSLSKCVTTNPNYSPGIPKDDPASQPYDSVWIRRLSTPWSFHWQCEEAAFNMTGNLPASADTHFVMLTACKKLHIDAVNFILESDGAEITDFDSLTRLLTDLGQINRVPGYLTMAFASVRRLNLAFKLPLGFCKALEYRLAPAQSESSQAADESLRDSDWNTQVDLWWQLSEGMRHLKKLRELHIWLDHNSIDHTWATINERAILSPFINLHSETQSQLITRLPILHPRWQTPDRHFTPGSLQSPFPIHRRIRQRYFGELDDSGHLKLVCKTDFPMHYSENEAVELDSGWQDLQEVERLCWESGQDPIEFFNSLEPDLHVCC